MAPKPPPKPPAPAAEAEEEEEAPLRVLDQTEGSCAPVRAIARYLRAAEMWGKRGRKVWGKEWIDLVSGASQILSVFPHPLNWVGLYIPIMPLSFCAIAPLPSQAQCA